ncbi:MAG: SDR family oxidoreductase [Chloroflexi bacterium]|nr:SDR family oxidoreductase [Chloroflexota bacterium]
MRDKICMVTGANAGIGRVVALALARQGAQVVMVCRSRERGEAAQAEIRQASGSDAVDLILADLSVQADVRRAAAEFQGRYGRLHILVNNAGAFFNQRLESADGLEMTFALNHLGYFLLTNLLLEQIRAAAPARIIVVSSDAYKGAQLDFADLQAERRYRGFQVYANSKLANILFTQELANRLQGTGVTVNALHPGFVASNFGLNNGGALRFGMKLTQRLFAISEEAGAETPLYLATSAEVAGITGKYFVKKKAVSLTGRAQDMAVARQLWQVSERLVGLG